MRKRRYLKWANETHYKTPPMILQILTVTCAAALTFGLTKLYIDWAEANGRMDVPNKRSSHTQPVAIGGGVVIVGITVTMWTVLGWPLSLLHCALLAGIGLLATISWLDDRTPLSPWLRLGAQIGTITGVLFFIPNDQTILPFSLPLSADRIITGIAWLWFINLFNFMDGMNGLASGEAVTITAGLVCIHAIFIHENDATLLCLIIAGASLGFLRWNWDPAKVFLGDVGSIPLGFILGFLLIDLAQKGYFIAAMILPLYFTADATVTLLARLKRGEKIWQPHNTHYYQRAHQGGFTHGRVVSRIMMANIVLLAAALMAMRAPWIGAGLAVITVSMLMYLLERMAPEK